MTEFIKQIFTNYYAYGLLGKAPVGPYNDNLIPILIFLKLKKIGKQNVENNLWLILKSEELREDKLDIFVWSFLNEPDYNKELKSMLLLNRGKIAQHIWLSRDQKILFRSGITIVRAWL